MPAEDERCARVDALFAAALALPEAERHAFLEHAAADDPSLAPEVEELLRLAADPAPGLAPEALAGSPLWEGLAGSPPPRSAASADLRVGAWRLISELGSGGMGTVWLAERADGQYQQKAALKLLQAGPQAQAVVDRFGRERQILASLDHPHIARLLDGGLTDEGRPWFAMEYVDGEPIDAFCDARKLPVEERLRLFIQVGRAVQAAHGSLVVHRDLKPSNILVTRDGYPRLLDFGIAKPLDAPGDPGTVTRTLLVLTPEYASPEQVRGAPARVASDVYQLGLLLYELLTGRRAQRLEHPGAAELERVVCERTPPMPSAAVAQDGGDEIAARARRTTPGALRRKLRGDLDAIVMRALRKAPERRYGFVAELVEDVERYLHGMPVRAQPEALRYRASKFVRRHSVGVTAGALFVLLLVVYAVTITWQARQLARERDQVRIAATRAEHVRDSLLGLLAAAHPYEVREGATTSGELLAVAVERIRGELGDQPEMRAELLGVVGKVLGAMAAYDRAEDVLAEALAVERRLHPHDHPHLAPAMRRYASILGAKEDWDASSRLARDALEMRRRLYGEEHEEVADSLSQVGFALLTRSRYREAEASFREAYELRRRLGLTGDEPTAKIWNGLGLTLTRLGRPKEAEIVHRRALAIRRRVFGPNHVATATILTTLATDLMHQGRFAEAEPLHVRSVEIRRRVFRDDHPRVAAALNRLGNLMRFAGRPSEAADYHARSLEIRRRLLPEGRHEIAESLHALAQVAQDENRFEEAERLYGEALSMLRGSIPEDHWFIGRTGLALGGLLLQQGRVEEAEPLLEEALAIQLAATGEDSYSTAEARTALGLLRAAQGRPRDARTLIEPGLRRLRDYPLADPKMVAEAVHTLAGLS